MSGAIKRTMVMLGLAEEDLNANNNTAQIAESKPEPQAPATQQAVARPEPKITPLRRVTPVQELPVQAMNEILTVHPTHYADAPVVAENFRDGVPVILNLSRLSESDAKRIIDFCSGLVLGLNGHIERVTGKVFLLTPEHITVGEPVEPVADSAEEETFFVSPAA